MSVPSMDPDAIVAPTPLLNAAHIVYGSVIAEGSTAKVTGARVSVRAMSIIAEVPAAKATNHYPRHSFPRNSKHSVEL